MDASNGSPPETWLQQPDDALLMTCYTVRGDEDAIWLDAELDERWERLERADPEGARDRVLGNLAANLMRAFEDGGPHAGQVLDGSALAMALQACRPDSDGRRGALAQAVPERLLRVACRAAGVATTAELAPLLEPCVRERRVFLAGPGPSWDTVALDNRLVDALNGMLETGRSFTELLGSDYGPVLARCLQRAVGDVYGAWRERPGTLRDWHTALDDNVLAGLAYFEAERRAGTDPGTETP